MVPVAKTFDFYKSFAQIGDYNLQAAKELLAMFEGKPPDAQVQRIKALEHEADTIVHIARDRLNSTYNTPFSRDDIYGLLGALDDVLDLIHACACRFSVYQVRVLHPNFLVMAKTILAAVTEIHQAVTKLRDPKQRTAVLDHCGEVNRMENQVDDQLREGLRDLFANEKDPIELIKTKETMEALENTSDACERVAHRIEGIELKHS